MKSDKLLESTQKALQGKLTKDVEDFIEQCKRSGKFEDWQINLLKDYSKEGLTLEQIKLCANPKYTNTQMNAVYYGFKAGLSIKQIKTYTDPRIPDDIMYKILNLLEYGHTADEIKKDLFWHQVYDHRHKRKYFVEYPYDNNWNYINGEELIDKSAGLNKDIEQEDNTDNEEWDDKSCKYEINDLVKLSMKENGDNIRDFYKEYGPFKNATDFAESLFETEINENGFPILYEDYGANKWQIIETYEKIYDMLENK